METVSPQAVVTPDPLFTEGSDLSAETLAQTEHNAETDVPFVAGDFVWAKVKGQLWWPALVSPERKKDSVLVSYFGDYDTLAWCEPKQLKPFVNVYDEMSKQSSSNSFLRALNSCMQEIEGSLGLEMTCGCVPFEAWPKLSREGGSKEVPVSNFSVGEFRDLVLNSARDVFFANGLETAQLRTWVFCFGKILMQGGSWEFHRRRGTEDLVDKIDLDALPVEMVGGKEDEEEKLIIDVPKRRRNVSKLIGEVDLGMLVVDGDDKEVQMKHHLISSRRRSKEKFEVVKSEEEVGSSSVRRERKKSKYLSPPYTNMREVGKFLAMFPKNSEERTPRKVALFSEQSGEEDDHHKSYLLKIERIPAHEFFSDLVATAANPLHLKGNRAAKIIKYFFAIYRKSKSLAGADFEYCKTLVASPMAKAEDDADIALKRELNGSSSNDKAYKETSFDIKRRKSNSKIGADRATKLDSEEPKRIRKNRAGRAYDLNRKQQKSDNLAKQKFKRKKIAKDGEDVRALNNLDFHTSDPSDDDKEKQKIGNITTDDNQGAPVNSEEYPTNTSDEDKGVQRPRNKKMLNDGTSKRAPAEIELHMVDGRKLGLGRKRCKNGENGDASVILGLQNASNFKVRGSKKKGRAFKNAAKATDAPSLAAEPINSRKPVLSSEKNIGSKEDANGKRFPNVGVRDAKLPGGRKSGPKKRKGAGSPRLKPEQRKAKRMDPIYGRPAALQLTFHSGFALPSREDLITSYNKYGDLIETGIELFTESNSARVVFEKATDAENAIKDIASPYGSVATYRLHYLSEKLDNPSQPTHDLASTSLQISDVIAPSQQSPDLKSVQQLKPPLPYIRKSLETMISTLAWSSSSSPVNNAGSSSDGLKPEARDNLVGEMQGLLQKVERMLNGASSGAST